MDENKILYCGYLDEPMSRVCYFEASHANDGPPPGAEETGDHVGDDHAPTETVCGSADGGRIATPGIPDQVRRIRTAIT